MRLKIIILQEKNANNFRKRKRKRLSKNDI